MRPITESVLRDELRNSQPETYYVPAGSLLTPAAREYLQQRKIKIAKAGETPPPPARHEPSGTAEAAAPPERAKYVDHDTGAFYTEKPEHMTQLSGNVLVPKDHPRILFRGKLDSLQALVVLDQTMIEEKALVEDLGDLLRSLREMMRCDVLEEPFRNDTIIGLTHEELRERSHDPMKFYKIRQMTLPDHSMGRSYALLNQLRTAIRETEVAACEAFREGKKYGRTDIIEELNRLSSAAHILMCKYLAGEYR